MNRNEYREHIPKPWFSDFAIASTGLSMKMKSIALNIWNSSIYLPSSEISHEACKSIFHSPLSRFGFSIDVTPAIINYDICGIRSHIIRTQMINFKFFTHHSSFIHFPSRRKSFIFQKVYPSFLPSDQYQVCFHSDEGIIEYQWQRSAIFFDLILYKERCNLLGLRFSLASNIRFGIISTCHPVVICW